MGASRINKLGLVVLSAFAASQCFATPSNCLTTNSTSIAVAGQQSAGAIIATSSSPTPDDLNTVNTAGGCTGVDFTFLNFTSTLNAVNTLAGTYISTSANQDLLLGPVTAVFSSVNGSDNVATDGVANDGLNNWFTPRKGPDATIVTDYQMNSTDAMHLFTLNLLGVVAGGGGGLVTGTVGLCLGAAWSGGGSGPTCSGTTQTITLVSGTNLYSVVLAAGNWTTIGIQNNFVLTSGNASGTAGNTFLTSFDETFEITPEPSTFALLGASLAGLAALRARRRKQAR